MSFGRSLSCFAWLSFSKRPRSFEEDDKTSPAVKIASEDNGSRIPGPRSLMDNSENRLRLSRESGRSRASSSELQKRVSFSDNLNSSKSFSYIPSLKAAGARKYPVRLDLFEDVLPSASPSDGLTNISGPSNGLRLEYIETFDLDNGAIVAEGSAQRLVEDVVDKLASTIHSTLFPQPPEPRYVLRRKSRNEEGLYLL